MASIPTRSPELEKIRNSIMEVSYLSYADRYNRPLYLKAVEEILDSIEEYGKQKYLQSQRDTINFDQDWP